jgi:hypothetical protein
MSGSESIYIMPQILSSSIRLKICMYFQVFRRRINPAKFNVSKAVPQM